MEKNRGRSELIKELHNKEGEIVKGTDGILKEVKEYYEELFSTQGIDEHEKNKENQWMNFIKFLRKK